MASLLNRAQVRRFILTRAAELRPDWGCTRVSAEALADIEAVLRLRLIATIKAHPTMGKTFRP
ncbi:MAG TPA: hypothetical protein VMY35_07545 [Phycisphaerae bacterium]|nr:hypothetical protein [Phycisphaerae bacterium]